MRAELEAAESGEPLAGDAARAWMLAGAPLTERRLQVAGISTAVLEGGDGPPLVLLHGGIECGGAVWAPVISGLAADHRLVVPDLPGLGESEPVAQLDTAAFAEWFAELLRQTCAENPALIAHSLAGSLAARFTAEHGDLLRQLVLYAAPAIGPYRMPLRLRVVAIRFALRPPSETRSDSIGSRCSISTGPAGGIRSGSRPSPATPCPGLRSRTSSGRCNS